MNNFAKLRRQLLFTLRQLSKRLKNMISGKIEPSWTNFRYISFLLEKMIQQLTLTLKEYERSESALREAKERFELMFDTSPAASVLVRIHDRKIVSCNEAFLTLGGFLREEVIGHDHWTLGMYDNLAEMEAMVATLKRQGHCDNVVLSYRNKRGEPIIGLLSAKIVTLNGDPHVLSIARDITASRAADEARRDHEERIRAITYSVQDAVLMMDPHGDISYWNPAATRIFGYTEDEAIGRNLHQLLAPKRYHERHRKAYTHFLRTGTGDAIGKTDSEMEGLHKEGYEIPIEMSLSAIHLQGQWHAIGVIRDITDRKKAEAELKASRARYHALVDQSFEALALVDIQTQEVVEVNRRFTEMLGYALPADAPFYVSDFVVDSQSNLDHRYQIFLHQNTILSPEFIHYRHKNGEEVLVERTGSVIYIDGKNYLLSSNRDMTEERKRQQQLAASLEELKNKTELLETTNALLVESQHALLHQATHDSLTGLLNRRAALDLLAKELVRQKRQGDGLAIGMCDLDHFKEINDNWGHQIGDEVLCWFSRILAASVREYDIVARVGGEEFLMVIPFSAGVEVDSIFERLCKTVADSAMKNQNGVEVGVTVSIGVVYATANSAMDKLLSEADVALYQAKVQGRNRVVYSEKL